MNIISRVRDFFSPATKQVTTDISPATKQVTTDKWGDLWLDPRITYSGNQPDLAACQRRNSFAHNKCPHCGQEELRLGPRGGMSQNILCAACGSKFNDTGIFGIDLLRDCTNPIPEMDNTPATHDHFGTVQPSAPVVRQVSTGHHHRPPWRKNPYMKES
ncbi:hypothetical protein LCGC14_0244780 [marine sediment metagenome]|uniref:GATA-type domain-containing protein n=1 Tax=marine sediment metagenome TaxID=412755 RepID=A0A0F9WRL5_9ZZZZ